MEGGICWKDLAVAEIAEAFAFISLFGKAFDDWGKRADCIVDRDARREEAIESGAVVLRSQVECVFSGSFTDETDLRQVGTAAAIGASGDTKADRIVVQTCFIEDVLEFAQDRWEITLALREGESACRKSDAGEGIQAEAGAIVLMRETMLLEDGADLGLLGCADAGDGDVLRRGESEVSLVDLGYLA